jgi:predicted O-methyltransferase YrrM
VSQVFRSDDWQRYRMDWHHPHRQLEPPAKEIAIVDDALAVLRQAGLPDVPYDREKMLAHRAAVAELFEIPWTAITPRMERLLYAINAAARPAHMIAAGVFCGFTFISNAGAAVGPGACYAAGQLIGIEIKPEEAQRAERNVRRIDPTGVARVVAADAVEFAGRFRDPIHLLYLDADGAGGKGKGIYLDILQAAYDRIPPGGVVLAHNSVNGGNRIQPYLDFVRDEHHFGASVNAVLDAEGLEVSMR